MIPDGLAAECQKPEHAIETWRDVAELARLRGDALDECDERMREIREITP